MSLLNESLILGGFGGALVAADQVLTRWHLARKARNQKDVETAIKDAVRDGMDEVRTEIGERFDANDKTTQKAAENTAGIDRRLVRIEAQFGPNGGGLREAVNKMAVSIERVATAQVAQDKRMDDHLKQAEDDRRRIEALERQKQS